MTPSQFKDLTDICTEVAALRAENKCLREDRDAWKEYAMRTANSRYTTATNAPGSADDSKE